jgi:hypothetical protein
MVVKKCILPFLAGLAQQTHIFWGLLAYKLGSEISITGYYIQVFSLY